MQQSGGLLLAAGLDGGNTLILLFLTEKKNVNESVLPCWMFCRNRRSPAAAGRVRLPRFAVEATAPIRYNTFITHVTIFILIRL